MTSPTVSTQVPPSLNTAVILAAGIGVRLKTVYNEAPNCLLELTVKLLFNLTEFTEEALISEILKR